MIIRGEMVKVVLLTQACNQQASPDCTNFDLLPGMLIRLQDRCFHKDVDLQTILMDRIFKNNTAGPLNLFIKFQIYFFIACCLLRGSYRDK